MKREEKSTLGFMIWIGSPMPGFLIAASVDTSLMNRLIIILVPMIFGTILMLTNSRSIKN